MSVLSRLGTIALACAALAVGCKKQPSSPTVWGEGPVPAPPAAAPGSTSTATPAAGVAAPTAAAPVPDSATRGTVAETMASGGYTYARLTVGGTDVWVAGPETTLAVGAVVDLAGGALMTGFHSNTLDRTFDQIYFLSAWSGDAAVAAAGSAPAYGGGSASPHATAAPAAALAPGERIPPAAGGHTIEQVFAGKATLAGQPVVVRGKVVKVNTGIMGKNWLHLQDSTGKAADGTHDLIVTSLEMANVGEIVSAKGTVRTDVKLGAGYAYDVMVEKAALRR